jgi:hypothetical protein
MPGGFYIRHTGFLSFHKKQERPGLCRASPVRICKISYSTVPSGNVIPAFKPMFLEAL